MIQRGLLDCDCNARYLVYFDLATSAKQARLINGFAQGTGVQVLPRFRYLYHFPDEPSIGVLGFLFSLFVCPYGRCILPKASDIIDSGKREGIG